MTPENTPLVAASDFSVDSNAIKPLTNAVADDPSACSIDSSSCVEHATHVYAKLIGKTVGENDPLVRLFKSQAMAVFNRLKPRDPIEEMIVAQLLWSQARLASLQQKASAQQPNVKWFDSMHSAVDRASNTYQKQVKALSDYRRPRRRRGGSSHTLIQSANIARQQVINQSAAPVAGTPPPAPEVNFVILKQITDEKLRE